MARSAIQVARRELLSISGISKAGNFADVEFTWRWVSLNPVGEALFDGGVRYRSTVGFRGYDDGWRVVGQNVPSNQPLDEALRERATHGTVNAQKPFRNCHLTNCHPERSEGPAVSCTVKPAGPSFAQMTEKLVSTNLCDEPLCNDHILIVSPISRFRFNVHPSPNRKPKLTLDEFFNSVSFTAAKVSPDGNSVVIATEKADWEQQIFRKELWLYRTAGAAVWRR